MTEREHGEDGMEVLRRMIAYVRDEAVRLRIMDVAILLEHAEGVVTGFAMPASSDRGCGVPAHEDHGVEH